MANIDQLLWKQCADWLCRLEVLPSNHRIVWPNATIQDLAYTLRDGVLLCHVASKLHQDAIDLRQVNQRPHMAQFLCLKNIRLFLAACQISFDMNELDLFEPSMLYDYTDFARVLHTISKLSNCSKALSRINMTPGFLSGSSIINKVSSTCDEEQIYRRLEDMVDDDKYEEFYYRHHGAAGGYGCRDSHYYGTQGSHEEEIYEDLCSFKINGSRRLVIQQINFYPKEKRDYCIKELLETEANYVDVLNMLRKHFIRVITSMSDREKRIIFMNIKELGENHGGFYQDILEWIKGINNKRLGEIFVEYKERFLRYGDYCSELPEAQELLESLITRKESVRDEIQCCENAANDGRFRLRDLLAVPMQRILKYHLLLRELLNHTPDCHDEYYAIQQAYEAMVDVSDYINEVKRDSEQMHIMREIEESIVDWNLPVGTDLVNYGRLHKDGELKIQSHEAVRNKVRFVFVFDKILLMCKISRSEHYALKNSLRLIDYRVEDAALRRMNAGSSVGIKEARWGHAFILVHNDSRNAYTLFARTAEDKTKWMTAIRDAISNVNPNQIHNSTHNPIMYTFNTPKECDYCHKLLKGIFYQGYRCEKCGRCMHKQCISLLPKCSLISSSSRPVSMQLPGLLAIIDMKENGQQRNVNGGINHENVKCVTQPKNTVNNTVKLPSHPPVASKSFTPPPPDYVNTECMENHSWYVGQMSRAEANRRLAHFPNGSFLVRSRVGGGGAAISLKAYDDVKHMKICSESSGKGWMYFLSVPHYFPSVVELIQYYCRNSLLDSFDGLDVNLRFAIGDLSSVRALFDFQPQESGFGSNSNLMALCKDDLLTVIDKSSGDQGWWKACSGNKTGYIPREFVTEIESNLQQDNFASLELKQISIDT